MDRYNLQTALAAAKAGFNVFPCRGYGASYKQPISTVKWGSQATQDSDVIEQWWSRYPHSIPSLSLRNTLFFVLDADVKHNINGIANLEKLFQEHGTDPNIYAQTYTPSGGRHYYFKLPGTAQVIRSTNGNVPKNIDVKGNNSCIIARSCITKEGLTYRRGSQGNISIADTPLAPAWLIETLTKPQYDAAASIHIDAGLLKEDRVNKYFYVMLKNALADLKMSKEGSRNNNLSKTSFRLAALLNVDYISYADLANELHAAAMNLGMGYHEATQTIKRSLDKGRAQCFITKDFTSLTEAITITHKGEIICQ